MCSLAPVTTANSDVTKSWSIPTSQGGNKLKHKLKVFKSQGVSIHHKPVDSLGWWHLKTAIMCDSCREDCINGVISKGSKSSPMNQSTAREWLRRLFLYNAKVKVTAVNGYKVNGKMQIEANRCQLALGDASWVYVSLLNECTETGEGRQTREDLEEKNRNSRQNFVWRRLGWMGQESLINHRSVSLISCVLPRLKVGYITMSLFLSI